MAPVLADSRAVQQKPARRPLPRIVPAIPHRLSRAVPAVRPVTPEASQQGTVTQQEPEPAPTAATQTPAEEGPPDAQKEAPVQVPLTPESRVSAVDKTEAGGPVLAVSPAASHRDSAEGALETPAAVGTDQSNGTANASATESPPVANGQQRKLTIPTQLPPPFYPSSRPESLTPPAQGNGTQSHKTQLSAGAVVFRSAQGSPALPATPQDTEPDLRAHPQGPSDLPPNFAPPQASHFYPGHIQGTSAPWVPSQYSLAPADPGYENGGDYRLMQYPVGPPGYSTPYSNPFAPQDASFPANGTGASHGHSPTKSPNDDTKPGSEGEERPAVPFQNEAARHTERMGESPFELAAYLSTQFGNPEFADFVLQVRSPESMLVSIPVHGIVVARSPVIAEATHHSTVPGHQSRETRRLIVLRTADPFITRESVEEAVKVLYGGPLLTPQIFLYGLSPFAYEDSHTKPSSDACTRMRQVLSYIAAAKMLRLPSMEARGVEMARILMRWDTIHLPLHYSVKPGVLPQAKGPNSDDLFTAALLDCSIEFLAYTFPVDFKLYTIAPELEELPRLPTLLEPRNATHNPRLSKIRFGEAPPEDDLQPSYTNRVLSSILLSLPAPLLERIFNHRALANRIGWTGAVTILRDVVTERELRRQKALRGQLKPSHDGKIPPYLLANMRIEEQVEPSPLNPSGHRITSKYLEGEV
ncbi:hypothetical protein IQ07DRAFT_289370 [Pyrenochaeta sp. DS3sAY3a]|nr:hypothetical protein IQ07DRAFT_289370 [Pyrenochaeta sp. DS3sAY3a]